MKLKAWLAKKGLTQTWFSEETGISQGHISDLCAGKKWPMRETARIIRHATGHEVTADDFLDTEDAA